MATSAVLVAGLMSQQAFAHAHLKTETPTADTSIKTAPTELSLGFSEGIEPNFSKVTLSGPNKSQVATGALVLAANDNTQAIVPLNTPLVRVNTLCPGKSFQLMVTKRKGSTVSLCSKR